MGGKGIRGSNHRRDTVSCFLSYNQGRVPVQPQRWVTHVLRTRDSRIDNRLNLRNEFDSLRVEDFLERTDHHLPYPLRRNRLSALDVAVTFGVVDTCSISTGDGRTEGTKPSPSAGGAGRKINNNPVCKKAKNQRTSSSQHSVV